MSGLLKITCHNWVGTCMLWNISTGGQVGDVSIDKDIALVLSAGQYEVSGSDVDGYESNPYPFTLEDDSVVNVAISWAPVLNLYDNIDMTNDEQRLGMCIEKVWEGIRNTFAFFGDAFTLRKSMGSAYRINARRSQDALPVFLYPALISAVVGSTGASLTITFNKAVSSGVGYFDTDFNIDANIGGNDISLTYVSGSGTAVWVYSISKSILTGEVVNLDFNGRPNSVEDANGNDLAAVANFRVTNQSAESFADIIFWDGFEGLITGTTYEATNYDYPAFHTWLLSSATSTCSLSQVTKRVGEKSLYLANCNIDFVAVFPGIDMRNIRFGMWVNSTAISRSLFSVFYSGNKNGYILNLTTGASITSVVLHANILGLTLPWVPAITTPDRSGWHFYEIALDVFNSSVKVYFDGVEVYSHSVSGEPTGSYGFDRISIGALAGVDPNAVSGYFDNMMVSTDPNRDLYALALLEACPKTS